MILYHVQPKDEQIAPKVMSAAAKYEPTGADETTTVLLIFPGTGAHGIATTSIIVSFLNHHFSLEQSLT